MKMDNSITATGHTLQPILLAFEHVTFDPPESIHNSNAMFKHTKVKIKLAVFLKRYLR